MKTSYTHYTSIPAQVPRQLAIEILQSHGEIITTNPLVLDYHPVKAPRDCPNDEYYSTWYEITERIQFVPGFKKMGSSKVTFKGCFHDMPWGVQTHMYVPLGVDLRNKWQIKGTQAGEPPEPRELGSGAPTSGLYLREDVEIKCNALALSFVKKEMKAASATMVQRMLKKAELLDAGVLQAMFENGKLKTFNPNDRTLNIPTTPDPNLNSNNMSPASARWRPDSAQDVGQRYSTYSQNSYTQGPHPPQPHPAHSQYPPNYQAANRQAPNQLGQIPHPGGKGIAIEMPGDFLYPTAQIDQNRIGSDHMSTVSGSDRSPDNRHSRWSVVSSDVQSSTATSRPPSHGPSPNPESKSFTAELPGSGYKDVQSNQPNSSQPNTQTGYTHQSYNPQNYARYAGNGHA